MHFANALERVGSLDEAWRFVLSGPRAGAPGADRYARLTFFLKNDAPHPNATADECALYLALVRRFLKSDAIEEARAKRIIATLAAATAAKAAGRTSRSR